MSFLGRRVAAAEGQFFREESGAKANELRKRTQQQQQQQGQQEQGEGGARAGLESDALGPHSNGNPPHGGLEDVLPEVLRHSVPLPWRGTASLPNSSESSSSGLSSGPLPKGFSAVDSPSSRTVPPNELRLSRSLGQEPPLIAVPQTRLGPSKYSLVFPDHSPASSASTANERRLYAAASASASSARSQGQQAKATAEALFMVSKAFGIATLVVYGGGALVVGLGMHALGITKVEDIPEKGRQFFAPRAERVRQRLEPLKKQVESAAERWRMSEAQQKAVGEKYAQVLGAQERGKGQWD